MRPDIPASPPVTRQTLSPPPLANRHLAGHTPLKAPRPGEFSPAMSVLSEKLSDTPTRSNTLLNESMADGVDEDRPLKGPLHMPSLPCNPGRHTTRRMKHLKSPKPLLLLPTVERPRLIRSLKVKIRKGQTTEESDSAQNRVLILAHPSVNLVMDHGDVEYIRQGRSCLQYLGERISQVQQLHLGFHE